jgi:predicted nucleic acid-binding protein
VIAVDTSVVVAFMNRRDDDHERIAVWMEALREDLFTTPLIIAEIDHLVSRAGGQEAGWRFMRILRPAPTPSSGGPRPWLRR